MSREIVPGLVSAVVASHNHARFLQRRMESLIGQTYPQLEILVIDDCSPDNSVEVLQAYADHPRVKLILREKNGGWVTVSNQGTEMSRGEYVLFANCDDDCEPQMIENLVAALEQHPSAGVAFCRSLMVDEHGKVMGDDYEVREPSFRERCREDCFLPRDVVRRFLMHSCVIPNLSAALIRRSCFDQVGVFSPDYKACSDWDFFFRVADAFDFAYVAAPLNHFRQHDRTIRSATRGRITYNEFFHVLLGQMGHAGFSAAERSRFRLHVMYLWAVEFLRPSTSGLASLPHHARLVASLDASSLFYLLPALMCRMLELPVKAMARLVRSERQSMLDPLEWPLFVRHMRAHPWLAPRYGLELLGLIGRRVLQRVRLRGQDDRHQSLKQRPEWLGPVAEAAALSSDLRLPSFALQGTMPVISAAPMREDDPEASYQFHRWANCVATLGDEVSARLALQKALTWISQPPERSDAAWESYSCCERVANLAILLAVHPALLAEVDHTLLQRFFSESAAWIDAHLEYYGPVRTNNHFLNNGRALLIAGCVTGNEAWVKTGLTIIERFAPALFPQDGCLREGSSHYQLVVAGWLFDVLAFAPLAASTHSFHALEKLAQLVGHACARLAATLPGMDVHIGDISPDLHPRLTLARLRLLYPERLQRAGASARLGEWLLAGQGQSALLARATNDWPKAYTTHAHADLGSFVWLHAGQAILADPGRQDYLPRPETRSQLGPDAHNTLLVNGAGALASSVLRAGLWSPRPYAKAVIDVEAQADGFVLNHNGYARLPGIGRHKREVRLVEGGLEVTDEIKGSGRAELSLSWHFAAGYAETGPLSLASAAGTVQVSATGPGSASSQWSDYLWSSAYGGFRPARCLKLSWQAELPCRIHTRFSFEPPCAA